MKNSSDRNCKTWELIFLHRVGIKIFCICDSSSFSNVKVKPWESPPQLTSGLLQNVVSLFFSFLNYQPCVDKAWNKFFSSKHFLLFPFVKKKKKKQVMCINMNFNLLLWTVWQIQQIKQCNTSDEKCFEFCGDRRLIPELDCSRTPTYLHTHGMLLRANYLTCCDFCPFYLQTFTFLLSLIFHFSASILTPGQTGSC